MGIIPEIAMGILVEITMGILVEIAMVAKVPGPGTRDPGHTSPVAPWQAGVTNFGRS